MGSDASPATPTTSPRAWRHRFAPQLRQAFDSALARGAIGCCEQVRLELLYSARTAGEFEQLRADLARLPDAPIGQPQWQRALDVYGALAASGPSDHRRVKQPDLLIAACAEAAGWPLLRYDRDFDVIARLTRQHVTAVAPLGSL